MAQSAESARVPGPRLSTFALLGMAIIGVGVLGAIFSYIFLVLTIPFESRLWWAGVASWALALAFFLVSAAERDRRIMRPFSGFFFLVGAAAFYASIALNPDPVDMKFVWLLVLSGLVVALLAAIFVMARGSEADAERRARRKVTP